MVVVVGRWPVFGGGRLLGFDCIEIKCALVFSLPGQ